MLPLAGFLALRFGFRPVIIASTAAFTAASVLCGLAGSLEALVLFRALQGIAGAALVPISQVLLLSAFPIEQAGWAMALWGMGVMGGPVIGPLVGGFLTEALSWRWVFFVNQPVRVLAVSLLMAAVPRTVQSPTRRFDHLGFVLLAAAIGFGQLFLDRGNSLGWFDSPEILAEAFLAAVCLYMFIVHSLTTEHPFLDLHLFRDRNFVVGLLLVPGRHPDLRRGHTDAAVPAARGHTPMQAGLLIAPRGVGTMLRRC
ncbi:MAG: MFS transporter [Gammaproteobacteria bacterium]|nr:MFS transporter [Gammaproteobacteria bacterium]